MSDDLPPHVLHTLLRLRDEILAHLDRSTDDTVCCHECLLPYPEGDHEAYNFCPWCMLSINGRAARIDESRKIIEKQRYGNDEIQCGECGGAEGRKAYRLEPVEA